MFFRKKKKFIGIPEEVFERISSKIQKGNNLISYHEIRKYTASFNEADIVAHELTENMGIKILFEGRVFSEWEDGIY